MKSKNIILLVADSLRIDRISSLSSIKGITPNIDNLVKNSLVFKNCIANSPWTLPSHACFFTGLYASEHKVVSQKDRLNPKIPCLSEILKNLGYFNICLTQNPFISKVFGLTRGFDICLEKYDNRFSNNKLIVKQNFSFLQFMEKIKDFSPNLYHAIMILYNQILMTYKKFQNHVLRDKNNLSSYIKRNSINDINSLENILKTNKKNFPFYLFINLMDTHYPYASPNEFLKKFNIKEDDFKIIKEFYSDPPNKILKLNLGLKRFKKIEKEILNKFYNASVNFFDYIIKKLLELLERLEIIDDTILILISDHGELLGDKNLWTHHFSVYDELLKVPVIIYNTNLFPKKIISNRVELKNLFHTIISMALMDKNNDNYNLYHYNKELSYLNQIKNNNFPEFIYGEYLIPIIFPNYAVNIAKGAPNEKNFGNIRFLKNNHYKYIFFSKGVDELYNTQLDPNETKNIITEKKQMVYSLKKRLRSIYISFKEDNSVKSIMKQKESQIIQNTVKKLIRNGKIL